MPHEAKGLSLIVGIHPNILNEILERHPIPQNGGIDPIHILALIVPDKSDRGLNRIISH
jgi:hypothetical protein